MRRIAWRKLVLGTLLLGMVAGNGLAWVQARAENNFHLFRPHLEQVVALVQEMAELYGYEDEKYDYEQDRNDNDFTWHDYDNDGYLTEYHVDLMYDDNYVDEQYKNRENCKKAYK